jgi:hypothetical protein
VLPATRDAAAELGAATVDLYTPFAGKVGSA